MDAGRTDSPLAARLHDLEVRGAQAQLSGAQLPTVEVVEAVIPGRFLGDQERDAKAPGVAVA